jgi:glycosyltransferase involved in cell wall biosynthesis
MPPPSPLLRVLLLTRGDPGRRTGGHLYNRRMAEAAAGYGARLEVAAVSQRPFPLATLGVPSLLRGRAPDLLVLDSLIASESAPWLRETGPPVVALLHQVPGGVDHGRIRTEFQTRFDLRAYRRAAKLIVASDYLADCLISAGFDRSVIAVVPPGHDAAAASPSRDSQDLRQGRRIAVLCVSNWMRNKGVGFLLEALARLPSETATVHLVGDDRADHRYAQKLWRRLAASDLRARVVVHGSLEPAALAALYRAADVFVLPSLREAYGTVCAEAMAASLPVVVSRTDNLPYLVRDGVEGLLIEPADVTGLAAAVEKLAVDPELRGRLAKSARERGRQLPSWEDSARRFFAELSRVAGGRE